jgi:hypothetical protein
MQIRDRDSSDSKHRWLLLQSISVYIILGSTAPHNVRAVHSTVHSTAANLGHTNSMPRPGRETGSIQYNTILFWD